MAFYRSIIKTSLSGLSHQFRLFTEKEPHTLSYIYVTVLITGIYNQMIYRLS